MIKKIMSLSAGVLLSIVVFAQDTTVTERNHMPGNNRDTTPGNQQANSQWPKDSVNKKTWPNTDTTLQHAGSWKKDTMNSNGMNSTYPKTSDSASSKDSTSATGSGMTGKKSSDSTMAVTDRILMKDDMVYLVKNNESSMLEKNYKLESGAIVTKEGTVKYPDGRSVKLKNGQFIELKPANGDGKKGNTKPGKKSTTTTKKTTSTNAPQ